MRDRSTIIVLALLLAAVAIIFTTLSAVSNAPVELDPLPQATETAMPTYSPEPTELPTEPTPTQTLTVEPTVEPTPTPTPIVTKTAAPTPTPTTPAIPAIPVKLSDYQQVLKDSLKLVSAPATLTPNALSAATSMAPYSDGCAQPAAGPVGTPGLCSYGATTGKKTMWLIGDDHAAQWFPALNEIALSAGYKLVVHTKDSCPVVTGSVYSKELGRKFTECVAMNTWWSKTVKSVRPDLLIIASNHANLTDLDAVSEAVNAYASSAKRVMILGDTPRFTSDVPGCVSSSSNIASCAVSQGAAFKTNIIANLSDLADSNGYTYVDVRSWLCASNRCPAVAADVLLYRTNSLLTDAGSAWLANILRPNIARLLG